MHFGQTLLQWYHKHGRDLPWRENADPYLVWLSEIILQQTRVDQGMSYFHRFREAFPTVQSLANADESEVLKLWQGLGYYSRARNLHATAKYITKELNGQFPQSYDELLKLKGVGPYTAAAIASIAFNKAHAVVDGNVYRVLARNFGIAEPIDTPSGQRIFRDLANELLVGEDPGTYNQAIMDFGATQCTPSQPGCGDCVFNISCTAYAESAQDSYPVKARKTKVKELHLYYLVLRAEGQLLIRERKSSGIWKGLWDFPGFEAESPGVSQTLSDLFGELHLPTVLGSLEFTEMLSLTHILSHRKITAHFMELRIDKTFREPNEDLLWVEESDYPDHPIPRLVERYWEERGEHLHRHG